MMELLAKSVPVLTTRGKIEDECDKAFENGRELGHFEAIEEAFTQKFNVTKGITEEEEQKVWDFLIENNLAIVYNVYRGGLRLRKLMSDREHTKEMVARKTKRELND